MWLILAAVLWFVFYSCLFVSGRESRKNLKGADALIALTPVEIRLIQKLREVKYGSVTAHIQGWQNRSDGQGGKGEVQMTEPLADLTTGGRP